MVASGVIEVVPLTGEWFTILIGREARTKKFNATRTELAQMVLVVNEQVLTLDRSGGGQ
jgi:hypothetical protein